MTDTTKMIQWFESKLPEQTIIPQDPIQAFFAFLLDITPFEVEIIENAERFFPAGGYKANVLGQLSITNAIQSFITGHDIMVTQFDGVKENSMVSQILKLQEDRTKCVVDFGDCSDVSDLPIPSKIFRKIDLASEISQQFRLLVVDDNIYTRK